MNRRQNRFGGLIFSAVLLITAFSSYYFHQDIYDWWRLRNYDPPKSIQAIAEKDTFTAKAERLFYVAHPKISSKDTFNQKCRAGQTKEFSIILGCYISRDGIYLYEVKDERLDGVLEVTGAHEMLHAAYERLGGDEKERINSLLNKTFEGLSDERVKSTIEQYRQNDPASVSNELHSILATEVENLPNELENYYKKYFKDRKTVVSISQEYESAFSSVRAKSQEVEWRINALKAEIDIDNANLEAMSNDLRAQREQLDRLEASGQTQQFNDAVGDYNNAVVAYNSLIESTKNKIAQYNALIEEYEQLSFQLNDLYKSIDSRDLKKK